MDDAYDDQQLAALQLLYDEIVKNVYGGHTPATEMRESIAGAVLLLARSGEIDWRPLSPSTASKTLRILREKNLLEGERNPQNV
jgi:hypothetical protein